MHTVESVSDLHCHPTIDYTYSTNNIEKTFKWQLPVALDYNQGNKAGVTNYLPRYFEVIELVSCFFFLLGAS